MPGQLHFLRFEVMRTKKKNKVSGLVHSMVPMSISCF